MEKNPRKVQEWRPGDPTPQEIHRHCEQIQSGWSALEREKRSQAMPGAANWHHQEWEVPSVVTAEIARQSAE